MKNTITHSKNISYIIPTVGRNSLNVAVSSILSEDKDATIIIESRGDSAGENRNIALSRVPNDIGWIMFLDDDDFLLSGYKQEIDNSYDIVVFTMKQDERIVPSMTDRTLRFSNVGINFAIKKELYFKNKVLFDDRHGEDWRFLREYIYRDDVKVKITDKVYYMAPKSNHKS